MRSRSARGPSGGLDLWLDPSLDPRLVAAARVPDDRAERDAPTFLVLIGAHTLQFRMDPGAGFEVPSTGVTVGGVVPTRVPAGGGPMRLDGVVFSLLGATGLVGLAVRRTVVSG